MTYIRTESIEEEKPLVSVITVNFNHSDCTLLMIQSLKNCTYKNIEIIVVDNGSSNDDHLYIKNIFPDIKLILLPNNLGFAGGNNEGIRYAVGNYILLLNNDTEVDPGFLEPMIDTFKKYSNVGIVSPRILYFNSPQKKTIQYAGAKHINLKTGRNYSIGYNEIDNGQYNHVCKSDYANGAALMFSRRVLHEVGCLPDVYFLYYEEYDWCIAAQKKGIDIYYVGTSKIFHKGSVSVGKNSPIWKYYITRNRILYLRRNASGLNFLIAMSFYFTISFPMAIFRMLTKKEYHLIIYFVLGVLWNFTHFKSINGFPQLQFTTDNIPKLTNSSNDFEENSRFIQSTQKKTIIQLKIKM